MTTPEDFYFPPASTESVAQPVDSTSTTSSRMRKWIRLDEPELPFVWAGLLPLLGLVGLLLWGLWPFAFGDIQLHVRERTQASLKSAGMDWVKLRVSGQDITLSGRPPRAGAGEAAVALARAQLCPTWLGEKPCAVSVVGEFEQADSNATAATPGAAPAAAQALQQAVQRCETAMAALLKDRKIEFAIRKAEVLAASRPLLDEIAKAAKECPGTIEVQGHTDSVGLPANNLALSEARAKSVMEALQSRGLDAARLKATGFGPDKPIADNTSAQGRAQNRRIEFRVLMP
jgi:outer membrane protein OmpA-like peptidoglycan-associated protein